MGIFDFADGLEKKVGELVNDTTNFVGDQLDHLGLDGLGDAVKNAGDDIANAMGAMPDEKQLGETDDPKELVLGDPSAIRSRADTIKEYAGHFSQAGDGLRGISPGVWTGEGARGFEEATANEWPKWNAAADAATNAAAALTTWASDVEFAQQKAAEAIALWKEAERKHAAWVADCDRKVAAYNRQVDDFNNGDSMTVPVKPSLGTDPEPALKDEAQRVLKVGRDHRNTAAPGIKSELSASASMAPPMPSTLEQLTGDTKDLYEGAGVASNHFGMGLLSAATQMGKFVRTADPMDPYNMANPGQYLQNAAKLSAGLTHQLANPAEIIRGFMGGGWSSDPAQSAGGLTANLLATVAPGPKGVGGLATKALVKGAGEGGAVRTALSSASRLGRGDEAGIGGLGRSGEPGIGGFGRGSEAGVGGLGRGGETGTGSRALSTDTGESIKPIAAHQTSAPAPVEPHAGTAPETVRPVSTDGPTAPTVDHLTPAGDHPTVVGDHPDGGNPADVPPVCNDGDTPNPAGPHDGSGDPASLPRDGSDTPPTENNLPNDNTPTGNHHVDNNPVDSNAGGNNPLDNHPGGHHGGDDGGRDPDETTQPASTTTDSAAPPVPRHGDPAGNPAVAPRDTNPVASQAPTASNPASPSSVAPSSFTSNPTVTGPGVVSPTPSVFHSGESSGPPAGVTHPLATGGDGGAGNRALSPTQGGTGGVTDAGSRAVADSPKSAVPLSHRPMDSQIQARAPESVTSRLDSDAQPKHIGRRPDEAAVMLNPDSKAATGGHVGGGDEARTASAGGNSGGGTGSGGSRGGHHTADGYHEPVNGDTGSPYDPANHHVNNGAAQQSEKAGGNEEPHDCGRTGEPVNVATGEYFLPITDVELPGVLPLRLTHQHRSRYRWGMWFGPTAVGTFDARVIVDPDGVTSVDADGTMLRFPHPQPDSPVRQVQGRDWELSLTGTGGYRLRRLETEVSYYFEPKPQLGGADVDGGAIMISAIMDRHLNRILFFYNDYGWPVAVEHSAGYRIEVDTGGARILGYRMVAGGDGTPADVQLRTFAYHDGHLAQVRNAVGASTFFRHDNDGRMVSWIDSLGQEYWNRYDDLGRVTLQSGVDGVWAGTFTYRQFADGAGSVTMYTDANGGVTTYGLDHDGRIRRQIDAFGRESAADYNASRDPLRRVAPGGATTTYRYTDAGDIEQITDPMGAVTRVEYHAAHQPSTVISPDGTRTSYSYDERGNLTSTTDSAGATTVFTYDETGSVVSVADPDGVVTRYENNAAGQPIRVIDAFGSVTQLTYDPAGRLITVVDAEGNESSMTYDEQGRRTSETDAGGAVQYWTYDGEGNCLAHTDAMGAVTQWEYGYFDLPVARIDADGSRTTFAYDVTRRLVSVTNAAGLVWRYEYNLDGTLASEVDFNGAITTYTYDNAGRLAFRRNAAGQSVGFTYDACGRVVAESSAANDPSMFAGESIAYSYDALGRLTDTRGGFGEWHTEYALTGLPSVVELADSRIDVEWSSAGRLSSVFTPSGMRTDYGYDVRGVIDSVTAAGRVCRMSTDLLGRETRRRFDGAAVDSVWDPVGRLVGRSVVANPFDPGALSLGGARVSAESAVESTGFTYRPDGALVGTSGSAGAAKYSLDVLGRVTERVVGSQGEAFRFDQSGNMSVAGDGAGSAAAGWSFTGTLLTEDGRSSHRYDGAGRLISTVTKRLSRRPDVWRYRWDAWDRLREVTVPDGTVFTYTYDHAGRRVSKANTVTGEVMRFGWLGDQLIEQSVVAADGAVGDTVSWAYVPGGLVPVAQVHSAGGDVLGDGLESGGDAAVSVVDSGTLNLGSWGSGSVVSRRGRDLDQSWVDREFFAIVTDQVSSPVALVDPVSAEVAGRAMLSVWGLATWSGEVSTPWRFPGQYFDAESGLHYNRFRYYQPGTGRYVSPDPLGLSPAPNPYSYPGNPTVVCDPLGLMPYSDKPGGDGPVSDQASFPSSHQILGRGSTGDVVPRNLAEQIAMKAAMADPAAGRVIIPRIEDPRWPEPGWTKLSQYTDYHDKLGFARAIEIHYLFNPRLGLLDDFKFKRQGRSNS